MATSLIRKRTYGRVLGGPRGVGVFLWARHPCASVDLPSPSGSSERPFRRLLNQGSCLNRKSIEQFFIWWPPNEMKPFQNSTVPHGGERLLHRKSTCPTLLTLGPHVVQMWSRYGQNCDPTKPAYSAVRSSSFRNLCHFPPLFVADRCRNTVSLWRALMSLRFHTRCSRVVHTGCSRVTIRAAK